jgi:uncharacterized protein (DUF2164 family)
VVGILVSIFLWQNKSLVDQLVSDLRKMSRHEVEGAVSVVSFISSSLGAYLWNPLSRINI